MYYSTEHLYKSWCFSSFLPTQNDNTFLNFCQFEGQKKGIFLFQFAFPYLIVHWLFVFPLLEITFSILCSLFPIELFIFSRMLVGAPCLSGMKVI